MSDPESTPSPAEIEAESTPVAPRRPSRLRRFFLRHLPFSIAGLVIFLAVAIIAIYFVASSAQFEDLVRRHLIAKLETATGGRVEIAQFHWDLLHLEAEADGVVIHGLEAPNEAPYAQLGRLRVRLSMLGFWIPRFPLRDLELSQPQLHLIVYPDGSTNQPQPRRKSKSNKPVLDSFFNLKASQIEVEQGVLDYENRAAAFDFQDRHIPLDFNAHDLSLRMSYFSSGFVFFAPPPTHARRLWGAAPVSHEFYRIEVGVRDLNLTRGPAPGAKAPIPPVHGFIQATLDLARTAATLRSMRITASGRGVKDRSLEITGFLDDFAHPRWQAKASGELDMRLVDPLTGYPFAPQGIAHLDLNGAGEAGSYRLDGSIHVDGGSYIGTGVVATGFGMDAHVHADPEHLLITSIAVRLRQGGQIDGDLSLSPWLAPAPDASHPPVHHVKPPSPDDITIPVNGKVTAQFKNVALDTLLEMVSVPPFQHLGFDSRVNGPATALWVKGDKNTLSVSALLSLTPPAQPMPGKTPASGLIDATYTERDGAVDLRKLALTLPSSQLLAHGHLGAYPMTSPTALTVDFHTGNLSEFDTVLRGLGAERDGRSGSSALPVALRGQGDFHGTWTGSLVDPHLTGSIKAAPLDVELPPLPNIGQKQPAAPRYFHLDSVEATGSYAAARIAIDRGLIRRNNAEVTLSGTLTAAAAVHGVLPSISASLLHLRVHATQVNVDDLQPFTHQPLPIAGALDAQLQLDGQLRALNGSGWLELNHGTVYGEPVEQLRAQGAIAGQTIHLTALTLNGEAGKIVASGTYDLPSRRFQLQANAANIDIARIQALRGLGLSVAGQLGLSIDGSGTFDDPRLNARANLTGLALGGEQLGSLELSAHTANRSVTYDLKSNMEATELAAHGQTTLGGDFATQAKIEFSHFDIGPMLRMAHLPGLNGESALAGTITLDGPLARPDALRGEARLDQSTVTVSGVHLKSEGGVHATLFQSSIHLDPLHITGEQTDLRLQASLSLKDKHQLDLAANGSVNLKLAETLDPGLTASGNASFQVEAHGPLMNPALKGRIDFQDAALSFEDMANGLSQLHGTLEFNQNRLEIRSLTAMSGGGQLNLSGYLAYKQGVYTDLTATGSGIRIRYPQGVSSLADAKLHLQGQLKNLLLSGDVLITRFTVSPDLDFTALAQQASAAESIAPLDAPSNRIRLDVHITSSPQLNFQNAYAKLAGNVDLYLKGTAASPSLLGRISITEGSALLAGTRYELQRGDIYFTNPVRIEPIIDLNATARVEDYDITLGLHGTVQKMSVTYHSDPPLPEADVVALLALGRTENQQRLYTQQQQQYGSNPATDALLGGALNATVSSRVQKLFGAGSVKVDPNYLGAQGNSTSRIIVEEQLGSKVTLTYATNVNTTAQQLIQAEVAINHHVSLQLARDESGVFSVVLKATRRYR